MQSSWIPVGLLYLGIVLFWLVLRRYRSPFPKGVADVVAQLSAAEQDHLAAMARSGRLIEAIQQLRAKGIADLRTAKATVEGLAIFRPLP